MATLITWHIPHQVAIHTAPPNMKAEDFLILDSELCAWLDLPEVQHLHLIIDSRQVQQNPELKTLIKLKWPRHPKYQWTVVLGVQNRFHRAMNSFLSQFFGVQVRMLDTMEEAEAFLREVDTSLKEG